jgi:hypothetical protein
MSRQMLCRFCWTEPPLSAICTMTFAQHGMISAHTASRGGDDFVKDFCCALDFCTSKGYQGRVRARIDSSRRVLDVRIALARRQRCDAPNSARVPRIVR